ncbi:hypothetical protein ACOSP7_021882 [Xanthoceras sorbifolium]
MRHPRVMKKVQEELENVVGKDKMVEESDLENLEYLDMVIKESLRLHPMTLLLLPHESMEDCMIRWNDPDKFFPERFVGSDIDLHRRDFQLIPFGSGRRSCPGLQLGLTTFQMLPDDALSSELDITEHFAGMDTSAAVIEWSISELMRHPRVMKKVQTELENVVGKDRMVEESDLENLEYLDMVIKESLRLHPVAPLLQHESMEDCIVNKFHILKKLPNNPDKFFPKRFVGSDIDIYRHYFQLIPFGSGRRSCAGLQLGLTTVWLVLAQLIHCFDWELPEGALPSELDMTEHFDIVISRAEHLLATPTYRLNKSYLACVFFFFWVCNDI